VADGSGAQVTRFAAFLAHSFAETGRAAALMLAAGAPSPLSGRAKWAARVTTWQVDSRQLQTPLDAKSGYIVIDHAAPVPVFVPPTPIEYALLVCSDTSASASAVRTLAARQRESGRRILGVAVLSGR
jgi:hypothetical protein